MLEYKYRLLLAPFLACILIGCGDSNRAKIIGTWGIDQADTVMSRIQQSDEGNADAPKMIVRFRSTGKLETQTQMGDVAREKTGQWEFVSYDPESSSMTIACEIQTDRTEHEINFIDQDTIELVPPNMAGTKMKLRFKRQ